MENIFNDKITFGDKIKKIRIEKGMNQKEFSTLLGVKQSYYSELENGKRELTTKILSSLKDKLNISIDWLISNSSSDIIYSDITSDKNITINESSSYIGKESDLSPRSKIMINDKEATQGQVAKAFAWVIFNDYKSKFDTNIKFDSFSKLSQQFWATSQLCGQIQETLELEIANNLMKEMNSSIKEGKEESTIPENIKEVIDKYDSIYNDFLNEGDARMRLVEITIKHQSTLANILNSIGVNNTNQ